MLDATVGLSRLDTHVAVAVDEDDPQLDAYEDLLASWNQRDRRVGWYLGPRKSLSGWTNAIAEKNWYGYRTLASLGDDHVPLTEGWDKHLVSECERMGGGFAYGNDLFQGGNLPTSVVISSSIVRALGWFCLPSLSHYFVDNVWWTLGHFAECLSYREDVVIEHRHPGIGKAPMDQTYLDPGANAGWTVTSHKDCPAFQAWLTGQGCHDDIETVRRARAA